MNSQFTPTQRTVLELLADGLPHKRQEIIDCLGDPLIDRHQIKALMYQIRKKIRPHGHDIDCVLQKRTIHYRHIRLLGKEED